MDELVDIVNEQDQVIGTVTRSVAEEKNYILRIAVVNIINERNELLLGVKHSRIGEDLWSIVGSGHVGAGEDAEAAAKREVFEETGYEIKDGLTFIDKFYVPLEAMSPMIYLYKLNVEKKDISLPTNNNEFYSYRWIKLGSDELSNLNLTEATKMNLAKLEDYPEYFTI